MNKKIALTVGTLIVMGVLSILKLRKTTDNESSTKKFKTSEISIEQINSRRWEVIVRALQLLQGEVGHLDMANLEFVEKGNSFIIKYYSENKDEKENCNNT